MAEREDVDEQNIHEPSILQVGQLKQRAAYEEVRIFGMQHANRYDGKYPTTSDRAMPINKSEG
jgi:hypothetical protein